jgi:RNA polymerase sigma factor (sigma-70 family)
MTAEAGIGLAALVDRARAGDQHALERLFVVCRPQLQRYARRHCESDDVEEAIQDALWIMARKLGGLRRSAALMGWLFQVIRRACLRYARRRPRFAALDAVAGMDEHDRSATDPELAAVLSIVISGLPVDLREALILRDVQGLSSEELAAALCISEEAAKSRVHRARAQVRRLLAETPVVRTKLPSLTVAS